MKSSTMHLPEAFLKASQHVRIRQPEMATAGGPSACTIALSREAGAGGVSVARAAGDRLGWSVYDHELVQRIADESGLYAELLHAVDERCKGWISACVDGLLEIPSISEHAYARHLVRTLFALAAKGQCVIVGRGAAHVLPRSTTLSVRLIGERDDRIATMQHQLGCRRDEAARWVDRTDRERNAFVRSHFHRDAADPHQYDLVLNTSRLSAAECAEFIVAGARLMQARMQAGRR